MSDINLCKFITTDEQEYVLSDILESTRFTEGRYTRLFENEAKKYLNAGHVIAVTNGTAALELIAQYLKRTHFFRNPLVCVPATTFPATLNAFLAADYNYILCDIDKDTLCMDIDTLSENVKRSIDVIVPVSLMGHTPDMDKIMDASEKYGWIVVEDFAEAFGTTYKGRKIGTIGHFGASSFYMSHVVSGGELGIVVVGSDDVAQVLKSMKNHGRTGSSLEFKHDNFGLNCKTNEFCAGLAFTQIKHVKEIVFSRNRVAKTLKDGINNPNLKTFVFSDDFSYLGFPILAKTSQYRDVILARLGAAGIETRKMFPCLASQKAYKIPGDMLKMYPNSVDIQDRAFYIPAHQYLTDEEIDKMLKVLNVV